VPIEIRELLIKAYIDDATDEASTAAAESSDKEEIIADCMQQVSELLKEMVER